MDIPVVAEILGIAEPRGELELIKKIREGFPRTAAERVAAALGLSLRGLSSCIRIPPESLREKYLDPSASEKLVAVSEVIAASREVLGEMYDDWLGGKAEILRDKRPIDMLDTGIGCRMIMDMLRSVKYGD